MKNVKRAGADTGKFVGNTYCINKPEDIIYIHNMQIRERRNSL